MFNTTTKLNDAKQTVPSETSGFSLLELMVAMGILTISFMAVIPLLTNTMGVNSSITMAKVAQNLATQKIEELMATPRSIAYRWLGTNSSFIAPTEYITAQGKITTQNDPSALYRRYWSINPAQVRDAAVTPVPIVLSAVVDYTCNGQKKSRYFTTMWSF